jgi:hypothetical protein
MLLMMVISTLTLSADSDPCIKEGVQNMYSLHIRIVKEGNTREDSSLQSSGCEFLVEVGEERTYVDIIKKQNIDGNIKTSFLTKSYFVGDKYIGTGTVTNDGVNMDFNMELISNIGNTEDENAPPTLQTFNKHENMFLAFGEESLFELGLVRVYLTAEANTL